jgi:hypothetical protein
MRRYEEAKTERDALATEILGTYTEAAAKIAVLLMGIQPVDQAVAVANRDRPHGVPYLDTVGSMTQVAGGWELSRTVRLPAIAAEGSSAHWPAGW